MHMKSIYTALLVAGVFAVVITATTVLAERGWHHGPGWGHHRSGWHHGGHGPCWADESPGYGYGYGPSAGLTDQQRKDMDTERRAFRDATESTHRELYDKEVELERELDQDAPDAKRAAALQKEISALRAEMDQRWVEHRIKMQSIAPERDKGYDRYASRGGGRGYGGGYGPGSCWR